MIESTTEIVRYANTITVKRQTKMKRERKGKRKNQIKFSFTIFVEL